MESWIEEYRALTIGAGLVEFSNRTQVELGGDDRASFLHNFCTNEIRKLPAGGGCEAFITTVQGKILAHVLVFSGPDSLVLETVPGQAERIIQHLDRYLIREKVSLSDRSDQWAQWLLAGQGSESLLARLIAAAPPSERLASTQAELAEKTVWLRRVDLVRPIGFLVDCRREDWAAVGAALRDAGASDSGQQAFEAARIEAFWPSFGQDISEKNLPQEVGRDEQTVSFTKGCYLGQETVARIDALGHVNKTLVGVRFESSDVPPAGTILSVGDQAVGEVTSSTFSPRLGAPLALAYVRRGSNALGTRLHSESAEAEVIKLPLA